MSATTKLLVAAVLVVFGMLHFVGESITETAAARHADSVVLPSGD